MEKLRINEAIVVEGRDDTAAVKQAAEALIIETHGFGIKRETWALMERAYEEKGLIVFTDPDYSGEEIRRKIREKFPEAKHAYLNRSKATKKDDIGIENGKPEDIAEALLKAHCVFSQGREEFKPEDLVEFGLTGFPDSRDKRQQLGDILGIGYGNGKALLQKLNSFNISREDFYEALRTINHKSNKG